MALLTAAARGWMRAVLGSGPSLAPVRKSALALQAGQMRPSSTAAYVNDAPEESQEPDTLLRRMVLEVRGHDPAVLKSYEWFLLEAARLLDIPVHRTSVPNKHIERHTVLRSAFSQRKHLVQYEMRTYFRVMELKYLTGSTASTYLEYIERNLPEGVAMKVTKHLIEKLPESIKPPPPSEASQDTVK